MSRYHGPSTPGRRTINEHRATAPEYEGFEFGMFLEDVGLGIAPYGGQSYWNKDFDVVLDPPGATSESDLSRVIGSLSDDRGHGIPSMVCGFLRREVSVLVTYGRSPHEIVHTPGSATCVIVAIPPYASILRLPGRVVQLVRGPIPWRLVALPSSDYWEIGMPRHFESSWARWQRRKTLRSARAIGPPWARGEVAAASGFSMDEYARVVDLAILRATNAWGWNARGQADKRLTYFEQVRRQVAHAVRLAVMREHLLSELNSTLRRTGLATTVQLKNCPSASQLEEVQKQLEDGTVTFVDALTAIRI